MYGPHLNRSLMCKLWCFKKRPLHPAHLALVLLLPPPYHLWHPHQQFCYSLIPDGSLTPSNSWQFYSSPHSLAVTAPTLGFPHQFYSSTFTYSICTTIAIPPTPRAPTTIPDTHQVTPLREMVTWKDSSIAHRSQGQLYMLLLLSCLIETTCGSNLLIHVLQEVSGRGQNGFGRYHCLNVPCDWSAILFLNMLVQFCSWATTKWT